MAREITLSGLPDIKERASEPAHSGQVGLLTKEISPPNELAFSLLGNISIWWAAQYFLPMNS